MDYALVVVAVVAAEMLWFCAALDAESTCSAGFLAADALHFVVEIVSHQSLIGLLYHVFRNVHNIDGVGQIRQYSDEGFCHFAPHIKILIFVL